MFSFIIHFYSIKLAFFFLSDSTQPTGWDSGLSHMVMSYERRTAAIYVAAASFSIPKSNIDDDVCGLDGFCRCTTSGGECIGLHRHMEDYTTILFIKVFLYIYLRYIGFVSIFATL